MQTPSTTQKALHVQVSGDVSQVEAQLASLQQALLHGKDVLHNRLQDEISARHQAEQTAQVWHIALPCMPCCPC